MAIGFQQESQIFTLDTAHTSYQMKVDDFGFLLHLYYGGRVYGNMDYLLTCYDRGFRETRGMWGTTELTLWMCFLRNIRLWASGISETAP